MITKAYKTDVHLLPKELNVKVEICTFQLSVRSSIRETISTNSSQIELVRGFRGLCGRLRTTVDWPCQSNMD